MSSRISTVKRVAGAGLLTAGALGSLLAAPASPAAAFTQPWSATFTQTWSGNADYRASRDFVPASTSITLAGKSCTSGTFWYVQLVKTSGSQDMGRTDSEHSDGQWHGQGFFSVSTRTAYYERWHAVSWATSCQGVQAFPVQ